MSVLPPGPPDPAARHSGLRPADPFAARLGAARAAAYEAARGGVTLVRTGGIPRSAINLHFPSSWCYLDSANPNTNLQNSTASAKSSAVAASSPPWPWSNVSSTAFAISPAKLVSRRYLFGVLVTPYLRGTYTWSVRKQNADGRVEIRLREIIAAFDTAALTWNNSSALVFGQTHGPWEAATYVAGDSGFQSTLELLMGNSPGGYGILGNCLFAPGAGVHGLGLGSDLVYGFLLEVRGSVISNAANFSQAIAEIWLQPALY